MSYVATRKQIFLPLTDKHYLWLHMYLKPLRLLDKVLAHLWNSSCSFLLRDPRL